LSHQAPCCQACLQDPPPYHRVQALFDYAWPIDQCIAHFKAHDQQYLGKILGSLMSSKLTPVFQPDILIPVPLHPQKQCQRGFNQTRELARIIAKEHRWRLEEGICARRGKMVSQRALSAKKRAHNVQSHSFVAKPVLQGKHVLVIEDVVTTGATVSALTLALLRSGAKTVEIWTCARTCLRN